MTIDLSELAALPAKVADLERQLAELKSANQAPTGPIFVTLDRAAELFPISVGQLRAWIKVGTLPASKRKRVWMVAVADVEQIIRSLRVSAPTPAARPDIEDAADSIVRRLPRRASR